MHSPQVIIFKSSFSLESVISWSSGEEVVAILMYFLGQSEEGSAYVETKQKLSGHNQLHTICVCVYAKVSRGSLFIFREPCGSLTGQ